MDNKLFPKHIAIIMDGNGRWARARGLPRLAGHKAGLDAVKKIIKRTAELNIEALSLFAFSSENWSRPPKEVSFLMDLFMQSLTREIKQLHDNGLRLTFIGDRSMFTEELRERMQFAETLTAKNPGMQLIIAINYGGKWDLVQATRKLASKVVMGNMDLEDINENSLNNMLETRDFVVPDLFIRTSGEQRISNFFLWQLAYAELYFTPEYWPDFTPECLEKAVHWFTERERRFGKTSEQLRE